jgi:hypothetical protein
MWAEDKPDVTFESATFSDTIFSKLDASEREKLENYPMHICFYGVPIRLERLFLDGPERKATYLTIARCGFSGSSSGDYFHLTMRLDEADHEADWAEKLLGQTFRFFGAYVNSKTEDLTCAHFEPVEHTKIERGFRFELRATGLDNDNGRDMVKVT